MNERAREVLVQAGLRGITQIRGQRHDYRGGACALGVLHLPLHDWNADEAMKCYADGVSVPCWADRVAAEYDLSQELEDAIVRANDDHGWDFLTIARKVAALAEGETSPQATPS